MNQKAELRLNPPNFFIRLKKVNRKVDDFSENPTREHRLTFLAKEFSRKFRKCCRA